MKSKINNSFKEEYTDIPKFVSRIKKELKHKRKASMVFWILFSALIAIVNISILTISSIALKKVLDDYHISTKEINFAKEVLPTAAVSAVSISLFIISIVISIYQGKMKSSIYKEAMETIQYEYVFYIKNHKKNEQKFNKKINSIYKKAAYSKTKKSFKKSVISILTGGDNE